ncbi:MAG: hypothetical protein SFV52_02850 [Saprospiraceae bacterium]|nr:hypothetical protein [Saprospiraceae bacterium]
MNNPGCNPGSLARYGKAINTNNPGVTRERKTVPNTPNTPQPPPTTDDRRPTTDDRQPTTDNR